MNERLRVHPKAPMRSDQGVLVLAPLTSLRRVDEGGDQ